MENTDVHRKLRERALREMTESAVIPAKYANNPSALASLLDTVDRLCEKIVQDTPARGKNALMREVIIRTIEGALQSGAELAQKDQPFADILSSYVREKVTMIERDGPRKKAHDVFVCHSSIDGKFSRKLAGDLAEKGYAVWFDEFTMLPGDSLYEKIQQGISASSWFIVVLSPDSVTSPWCKRELYNAMEEELERKKVYVVPVLYRDCDVPGFLKEKFWADCRGRNYKQGLELILERLRRQADA